MNALARGVTLVMAFPLKFMSIMGKSEIVLADTPTTASLDNGVKSVIAFPEKSISAPANGDAGGAAKAFSASIPVRLVIPIFEQETKRGRSQPTGYSAINAAD